MSPLSTLTREEDTLSRELSQLHVLAAQTKMEVLARLKCRKVIRSVVQRPEIL